MNQTPNLGLHTRGPLSFTALADGVEVWDFDANMEILDSAIAAASAGTTEVIYASNPAFGLNANTLVISDCSWSTGSKTITSAGQAKWTQADVGKRIFGFQSIACDEIQNQNPALGAAATTIVSVLSPTQITVSTFPNSTVASAGVAIYGTPDDAAQVLIEAAANASPVNPKVVYPQGNMLWTSWHFQTLNPLASQQTATYLGGGKGGALEVCGQGMGATTIFIVPDISMATATKGTSGNSAIVIPPSSYFHDFSFSGGGNSRTGSTTNNALIEMYAYSILERVGLYNFGSTDSGTLYGVFSAQAGLPIFIQDCEIDGWGANAVYLNGSFLFTRGTSYQDCMNLNGGCLSMNGVSAVFSGGGNLFNAPTAAGHNYTIIRVGSSGGQENGSLVLSPSDFFGYNGATALIVGLALESGSVTYLNGCMFNLDTGAASIAINQANGSTVYLCNCTFVMGAAGYWISNTASTSVVYDIGGNTIVSGQLLTSGTIAQSWRNSTAATASAGSATLPANPVGFTLALINGQLQKIPYYGL
jgi:hypothetical protein